MKSTAYRSKNHQAKKVHWRPSARRITEKLDLSTTLCNISSDSNSNISSDSNSNISSDTSSNMVFLSLIGLGTAASTQRVMDRNERAALVIWWRPLLTLWYFLMECQCLLMEYTAKWVVYCLWSIRQSELCIACGVHSKVSCVLLMKYTAKWVVYCLWSIRQSELCIACGVYSKVCCVLLVEYTAKCVVCCLCVSVLMQKNCFDGPSALMQKDSNEVLS